MGKNLSKQHRASANGSSGGRNRYNKARGRGGSGRAGGNDRSKYMSCPDVGSARVPTYDDVDTGANPVNVTLYRSYGNVEEEQERAMRERIPEVRIYRRSTASLPAAVVGSSRSLPRNFGRNATATPKEQRHLDVPDGSKTLGPRSERGGGPSGPSTSGGPDQWAAGRPLCTLPRRDPTTPSSTTTHSYSSILSDDRSRGTPIRTAISPAIPDMNALQKKLEAFEKDFTMSLVAHFAELPLRIMTSKVSLATGRRACDEGVSLRGYLSLHALQKDDNPAPPIDQTIYVVNAPKSIYETVRMARSKLDSDERLLKQMGLDLVRAVATEVSKELIRIFEYQIGLLLDGFSIGILARYAARCVCRYVTDNPLLLNRNTAIEGVLRSGEIPASDVEHVMFSVLVDGKEYKWYLTEMLSKPGLRKDHLFGEPEEATSMIYPWSFCSKNDKDKCDIMKYGYRGVHMEWDFVNKRYQLWHGDQGYTVEKVVPGDIHQQYIPLRQIVNENMVREYLTKCQDPEAKISLSKYILTMCENVNVENELVFVCRPTTSKMSVDFLSAELDHLDMMRCTIDSQRPNAKIICSDVVACFCTFYGLSITVPSSSSPADASNFSYSTFFEKHLDDDVAKSTNSCHVTLLSASSSDVTLLTTGDSCTAKDLQQDILDRTESFERSDAESADSLDALDTYTLTTFLGQNIVSKPQSRHRKRRLRHSTAGTNQGPRTTNQGNIVKARGRPHSTSTLPQSSLASHTSSPRAGGMEGPGGSGEVWQRAPQIPTLHENSVSNHVTPTPTPGTMPPPPPPPVVQMPTAVSGSLPSVTESPARLDNQHHQQQQQQQQQQHKINNNNYQHNGKQPHHNHEYHHQQQPPQHLHHQHHPHQHSPVRAHALAMQHSVTNGAAETHSPVHHTQHQAPQPHPQERMYNKNIPPPSSEHPKNSTHTPTHTYHHHHHNVIHNYQPKKPPRTFETTDV